MRRELVTQANKVLPISRSPSSKGQLAANYIDSHVR